jgi:hypothetical protein
VGSVKANLTKPEPLGTLTTYELRDRRQNLDAALRGGLINDRTRIMLECRLAEVVAEQDERARARRRGRDRQWA